MEVALFLSVSGLLFIGIAAGVQNSVWQQRVNDSVQSFAEFLKTVYSQVSNPQGAGTTGGRSDKAIYGKLISFGQGYQLSGEAVQSGEQEVFVYDVVGDAESNGTGDTISLLGSLDPKVVVSKNEAGTVTMSFAGMAESYIPRWTAVIQNTGNDLYEGSILIVRNPRSGTVNTFVSPTVLNINQAVAEKNVGVAESILKANLGGFSQSEVNFCINPYGDNVQDENRKNVRLLSGAHNASGVVIVGDGKNESGKYDNQCKE